MTPDTLVSVIIPTYNCAPFLRLAVQSALDQDYANKEIIVIDDGSTDDTAEVLSGFGSRISVMSQQNAGIASARNAGIKAARGSLIAFLDSDDYWLPGKLRKQAEYLAAHPDVDAVYCAWHEWRPESLNELQIPAHWIEGSQRPGIEESKSGMLYNKLLQDCIILTSTLMLRRSTAEMVGPFDPGLRRGQDYDYWIRLSRVTPIHKLKAALALYRIHSESITHQPHRDNYPCLVIEKALAEWGPVGPDGATTPEGTIRRVLAKHWFDFGYLHLKRGDARLACRAFLRSGRLRPTSLKTWLNAGRSLVKSAFSGKGA